MDYIIWFLVSVIIGAAYAFLMYYANAPWSRNLNYGLASLRFILVSGLAYLLFCPLINQNVVYTIKPIVVFAVDNSLSMNNVKNIKNTLADLKVEANILADNDIDVKFSLLDGTIISTKDTIPFIETKTDLSYMLSDIASRYEGNNLATTIILSDGIYNAGFSPLYQNYNHIIHTIGVGDTVPHKDLILNNILYNKITNINSKTPIVAEIRNVGLFAQPVVIYIKENGKIIAQKNYTPKGVNSIDKVEFLINCTVKGLHKYVVEVAYQKGEYTQINNTASIYVDVVDGNQKILIAANSPHPDISALTAVIENNPNFELDIFIPGMTPLKQQKYDLVIFHQIPHINTLGNEVLESIMKQKIPALFILGNQSNINKFNSLSINFSIIDFNNQQDKVTPEYNPNFTKFTIDESLLPVIKDYSPLSVPFGNYKFDNWDVLLFQKIGMASVDKPLVAVNLNNDQKVGIIAGEGIWQWSMNELVDTDNNLLFANITTKLIQLLAKKEDKRKLRFTPTSNEFDSQDHILFNVETYNDIYENTYDHITALKITNESGKIYEYTYTNSQNSSVFEISNLPQGIYKYTASALLSGKNEVVKGEFLVTTIDLENQNSVANNELLRQISLKNEGIYFQTSQISNLAKTILQNKPKARMVSDLSVTEIINWKWLFFVFIIVATFEWIIRKQNGSY